MYDVGGGGVYDGAGRESLRTLTAEYVTQAVSGVGNILFRDEKKK
jgi:hypothetical protein